MVKCKKKNKILMLIIKINRINSKRILITSIQILRIRRRSLRKVSKDREVKGMRWGIYLWLCMMLAGLVGAEGKVVKREKRVVNLRGWRRRWFIGSSRKDMVRHKKFLKVMKDIHKKIFLKKLNKKFKRN